MSTTTPTNTDPPAATQSPTPPPEPLPLPPVPDQPSPPRRPWQVQPGESPKAFLAFQHYLDLGENATLRAVAEALHATPASIEALSRRHNWRERAALWQEHLAQIHCEPFEKLAAANATLWAQRQQALRQQQWQAGDSLVHLGLDGLSRCLNGQGAKPTPEGTARVLKSALELQHQAADTPTGGSRAPDDSIRQAFEASLQKTYGSFLAATVLPSLKDQLERERPQLSSQPLPQDPKPNP